MALRIPDSLRPDERVLVLGIPDTAELVALAGRLPDGALVAIGEGDAVYAARAAVRELDNVMIVPGTPDDLPWRDGFFTRVIDAVGAWPDEARVRSEVKRVTAREASNA